VLAADFEAISETSPDEVDEAMEPEHASMLRDMMIASENNTSGGGKLSGVQIASKTGTAEHGEDVKSTKPHAWYVGFAPAQ
ncbi:penicillin-binding protein 2, partial [Saccharothrix sp. MB29]|nr:penicillin-binding protein 2 [Saccharothrix sp. MB29]